MATEASAPLVEDVPPPDEATTTTDPQPTAPPMTPMQPGIMPLNKRRRSWKEKLAFLQNLKFFAIFLIPIFLFWLIFLPAPSSKVEENGGYFLTINLHKDKKDKDAEVIKKETNCDRCYKGLLAMLIVGGYWLTSCMPLPGAAFFPMIAYPLMKIQVGQPFINTYMKDTNMMAFATIQLALSAWTSGLTKRVAIKILALTGGNLRRCSFLVVTLSALMSMWYPDTAVMMFIMDVMEKMGAEIKSNVSSGSLGDKRMQQMKAVESKNNATTESSEKEGLQNQEEPDKTTKEEVDQQKISPPETQHDELYQMDEPKLMAEIDLVVNIFKITILHSVGIIVCIGGLYWPHCSTGAIQLIASSNPKAPSVDIGTWMGFSGPVIGILLPLAIWYLDFFTFALSCRKKPKLPETETLSPPVVHSDLLKFETSTDTRDNLEAVYNKKYTGLGKFNAHEVGVIVMLVLGEVFFMASDPQFIYGWSTNLNKDPKLSLKVSSIAMLAAVIAFVVPKSVPEMFKVPQEKPTFGALIGWKTVQSNFPWGLIIFIGGGLAIAKGTIESRLVDHIETQLIGKLGGSSPYIYLAVLMFLSFALACVVSNTAAVGIIYPIAATVGVFRNTPSPIFIIPCVAVTSLAFITPAGTPALALLHMRTEDRHIGHYLHAGALLSVIGFIVIYGVGASWIALYNAKIGWVI